MTLSVGTATTIANQTGTSGYSFSHTCDANTKALVVIITGADSSDTDAVISGVSYNSVALSEARTKYRVNPYQISFWILANPPTESALSVAVTLAGSNTDSQATAVCMVSATAVAVKYDTYNESTTGSTTTHDLVVSSVRTGSIGIGGIVDVQSAVSDLSVTSGYGTEITDSERDMGSQVVGCAYRAEASGEVNIRWTKSGNAVSYAQVCTFYEDFRPTVALSTPADEGTVTTLNPSFVFTGSDLNATDQLEYQIYISDNTFYSSTPTIDEYRPAETDTSRSMYDSTNGAVGQTITGTGMPVATCTFLVTQSGDAPGLCYAKIYNHTGTWGSTGTPTGVALATSDGETAALFDGTPATFSFSGVNKITLDNGTHYCLVLEYTSGDISKFVSVLYASGGGHSGNNFYWNGSGWTTDSGDYWFGIYSEGVSYYFSSLTDTHANWVGTGDPHPWLQGTQITFTTPTALTNGETYYWKVAARDTAWGSYTSNYSFTVQTETVSSPKMGFTNFGNGLGIV